MVEQAIQQIAGDGQLVECDLTLRELDAVARSFAQALHGLYSARPAAPSPGDARPALRVLEPPPVRAAGK